MSFKSTDLVKGGCLVPADEVPLGRPSTFRSLPRIPSPEELAELMRGPIPDLSGSTILEYGAVYLEGCYGFHMYQPESYTGSCFELLKLLELKHQLVSNFPDILKKQKTLKEFITESVKEFMPIGFTLRDGYVHKFPQTVHSGFSSIMGRGNRQKE